MVMTLFTESKGNVAVSIALFLLVFLGFVGLSVDLGILYTAKSQLQNAADAASLAGTGSLVTDPDGDGIGETDIEGAKNMAIVLTESNTILDKMLQWSQNDTFNAGKWDHVAKAFMPEYSDDPKDMDGSSVSLKRSINTHFIKVFGISSVDISVKSTAFIGCAGNGTRADLPIAINCTKLVRPFELIVFNNEHEENGQYTSFDIWPCNKSTITPFIKGSANGGENPPPMNIGDALNMGDELYMNNGVIAALFSEFEERYNQEKDANGEYPVILPVVEWHYPQNRGILVGFVYFVITEVNGPGGNKTESKQFVGYMGDGVMLASDSESGGACYGVRASQPVLVKW